jgi:molecular chaperone DnaK (HSP70)
MARLGIDYGTTNTVVVCADRGRYPLVPQVVDTAIGRVVRETFPSLIVFDKLTDQYRFGAEAERAMVEPGANERYIPFRSFKRILRDYADGTRFGTHLLDGGLDVSDALIQFARAVYASVRRSSMFPQNEPLEAVLTWPANANGAQRHITRKAFKEAGFQIASTLNEPSAAAIELADRLVHGDRTKARQVRVAAAVFDLGGGTFDASLVKINGQEYTVVASAGIERLGGDDFDEALARLFAEKLSVEFDGLSHFQQTLLLMHACREKERLSLGTVRQLTLDPEELGLSGPLCRIPTAVYEKHLAELMQPAVEKLADVIRQSGFDPAQPDAGLLDAIYLVGGSSRLPLAARLVTRRFPGIRVLTTDKPFSATAMGAAIHGAEATHVSEVFARHFGVIRLAYHGSKEVFAPIFAAGVRLPERDAPPVTSVVSYTPRHNIAHLRFLECTAVDEHGYPSAGLRPWSEVLFPYDPALPLTAAITPANIVARDDLQDNTVETYTCDADGIITVTMTRGSDGQSRTFEIFRA